MTKDVKNKYEFLESKIFQKLKSHLPNLRKEYEITFLGIFGSYVRREEGDGSDLDILVEFERAPTFFQFVRLKRHLSEFLGVPVDLVMKKALKPVIGRRILGEVVSL